MNASASAALPRILLLEDDPISAAFLCAALEALPARVDVAGTLADAGRLASTHTHDLWLFDANLPDGLGADLLAELRAQGLQTMALAHTADPQRTALDALIAAGFKEVLLKPLSVAQLQGAARRFCRDPRIDTYVDTDVDTHTDADAVTSAILDVRCGKQPIWDDHAALRALNGNRAHVDTMRGLFAQELHQVSTRIAAALANRDTAALSSELHKLQASCGFVGAARLGTAARVLQHTLNAANAMPQFEGALQDTRASLSG